MNFFILRHAHDSKTVGKFPQLEKMFDGFNMLKRNELWDSIKKSPNLSLPKVTGFKLKHHAKLTDLISAPFYGSTESILISERFYKILIKFRCMKFIEVDSELFHHSKRFLYKFLFFPENQNHFVDFNRSRFYLNNSGWIGDARFESYAQFSDAMKNLEDLNHKAIQTGEYSKTKNIRALELFLDESKIDLDFFKISKIRNEIVVSSALKEKIELENLSGMSFFPAQGHLEPTMDYTVNPPRQVI